ncbi:hypothetical protein LguiA_002044 [Lonicera macranthoides]
MALSLYKRQQASNGSLFARNCSLSLPILTVLSLSPHSDDDEARALFLLVLTTNLELKTIPSSGAFLSTSASVLWCNYESYRVIRVKYVIFLKPEGMKIGWRAGENLQEKWGNSEKRISLQRIRSRQTHRTASDPPEVTWKMENGDVRGGRDRSMIIGLF